MPRILLVSDAPEAPDLGSCLERDHGMDLTLVDGSEPPSTTAFDCLAYDPATAGVDLGTVLDGDDSTPVVLLRTLDECGGDVTRAVDKVADQIGAALPDEGNVWAWAEPNTEVDDYRGLVANAPDPLLVIDTGTGELVEANRAATAFFDRPRSDLLGRKAAEFYPEDCREEYRRQLLDFVSEGSIGVNDPRSVTLDVLVGGDEVIPVDVAVSLVDFDGTEAACAILHDASERLRRRAEISDHRDRLSTLDRINSVIRDVDQHLVGAATRAEIEQGVCERLAASDSYRFAWIGAIGVGGEEITPRAWAGVEEGDPEEITVTTDGEPRSHGPSSRAATTGAVEVSQHHDRDPSFEPWHESALAHGSRSSAAIPLAYDGTVYGVLNVYAARTNAFDEYEREVLSELGEIIGHAMNAIERKRMLASDGVTELEIRVPDAGTFFAETSVRLDCCITIEGSVQRDDGPLIQFCTISGTNPEAATEVAAKSPKIDGFEVLAEQGDCALFKLAFCGRSVVRNLVDFGARVKSVVSDNGEIRVVATIPHGIDVRTVFRSFHRSFPSAELIAQREVDQPVRTDEAFRSAVAERLTEKQLAALRAAHLSGFFEWPRLSTGEEVAETLDVSPSTLHQHLRVGEDKLVSVLLDD